jgi:hypothetical protein
MATTTTYSWTTPDDTALVKDGASAIRSLGTAIDTTTKNLNPQTTTGAIAYRSATSNVNTSLPIGTAGQVLTVNSGATAPEWATPSSGGMTLISTTSLSGSSSISLSSIPSTYINLHLVIIDASVATGGNWRLYVTPPSGSVYAVGITGGGTPQQQNAVTNIGVTTIYADTATKAGYYLTISQYASSTYRKFFHLFGSHGTSQTNGVIEGGWIDSTSAISSLTITNSTPTNFDAGTALLYGVK